MVASASSCAADANADNIRARALFLFFILTAILLNVAGIILARPTTRNNSNSTTTTTIINLSTSMLTPQTKRASEALLPCHTV